MCVCVCVCVCVCERERERNRENESHGERKERNGGVNPVSEVDPEGTKGDITLPLPRLGR